VIHEEEDTEQHQGSAPENSVADIVTAATTGSYMVHEFLLGFVDSFCHQGTYLSPGLHLLFGKGQRSFGKQPVADDEWAGIA
jgi:hypothetical protein